MSTSASSPNSLMAFFVLWAGQAVSIFGSRLSQFALIWWLTVESGSATALATASLVGLLPSVVLGPIIGALVDRWNRKRILFIADSAVALASLVLATLFFFDVVALWHVYLVLFARAVGGGFHEPTMMATTSLMVPERHLNRVQGMNQTLSGVSGVAAAPLGAALVTVLPLAGVLLIDAATALFAVVPLLFLAIPQPVRVETLEEGVRGPLRALGDDLLVGLRYVQGWTGLWQLLGLATVVNLLFAPAFALLPLLVTDHFGGGALQLGALEAAAGVGMISGGVLLGVWGGFNRRMMTTLFGLAVLGLSTAVLGAAPAGLFTFAVAAQFVLGAALPFTNGPLFATLQAVVAPELQGRVFTLAGSLAGMAAPLGLLVAGPVADLIGVRALYLISGAACVLLSLVGLQLKAVLRLEEGSVPETVPKGEGTAGAKAVS